MKKILHKIAHLLHLNFGSTVSELRGDNLWVGFYCWGCGQISDWHKAGKRKKQNDNIKQNKIK